MEYMKLVRAIGLSLAGITATTLQAQVSNYTFSQEIGTWQPIAGNGTPMGMPGLGWPFTFDDNSFVVQGDNLPLGSATTGNGWPIGFTFNFNGQAFDRVGLSMEGWLAFGHSSNGQNAVYVPAGSQAYTPLSAEVPGEVDPSRRNRVAAFSMDLAAMGNGGTWPLQIRTSGAAPNRVFTAEWNVVRSGGSNTLSFQIQLSEGGGDPAAQTVKVVYGNVVQTQNMSGQVGLGGSDASDFNNRSVTTSPYNWAESLPGATNTATCRLPSSATNLPAGLTFIWTPAACQASGIQITGLGIVNGVVSATLSWTAVSGASTYDYIITTGAPTDPVVASGSGLTGTTASLTGLPVDQPLHAYVRTDCGDGPGSWGSGSGFTTEGLIEVVCGEAPLTFTHCYTDLEERFWYYRGTADEPLRVMIHAGSIASGDVLVIYDGPNDQSPVLFTSNSGPIAGQIVNSTGRYLTMKLVADHLGSCAVHEFIFPMEWEVGCVDCDPVFANYTVVDDCEEGQFTVNVQVFSLGSADQLTITNNGGAPVITAAANGQYTVGPFPNGTVVEVRAENPVNDYCSSVSGPLLSGACPIVDCGPEEYTYCYTDLDLGRWAYAGVSPDDRIGIRFISGSLATGDQVVVYDGNDEFMSPVLGSASGQSLAGSLYLSSVFSNTIMLTVNSNASSSCATGHAQEWEYVVACYDGCAQPVATYSVVDDCANGQYSINVNVTSLGSATGLVLTHSAGAGSVSVAAVGSYTVGPFPIAQQVSVFVEGSSELCSTSSALLSSACTGVGMGELDAAALRVYPNPSNGSFRVVLERGKDAEMEVLDLSGRRVAGPWAYRGGTQGEWIELGGVQAGSYWLVMRHDGRRTTRSLQVVH